MTSDTNIDILLELSIDEIVILGEYYKQRQDVAPHIYSHLLNILAWHKSGTDSDQSLIQVFAPDGGPETTNGTFISIGNFSVKIITPFSMGEHWDQISDILRKTTRLNIKKNNHIFYAIQEEYIPALDKVMTEKSLKKCMDDRTLIYSLDPEEALTKKLSYPEEYIMKKLETSNASKIYNLWPYNTYFTEDYVRMLVKYNKGCGMFNKADNQLVAWMLKSQIGCLGLLQVVDEHKQRGLAQALIYAMSREIALEGLPALTTISETNIASLNLFTKCGFKSLYSVGYLTYE